MRVIALEEHFLAPAVARQFEGLPMAPALVRQLSDLGEARITDMDAAGIDYQILGHTAPGLQGVLGPEAAAVARETNDFVADAVRQNPSRLGAFAVLPTADPEAAARELEHAKHDLGFVGSMINGMTAGKFLDDSSFEPLLAAAEELRMPIYLHPAAPPPPVREAYFHNLSPTNEFALSTAGWGWHAETATHVLRIILGGVFDRHPDLQLVIGHMGEALPFFLARIDWVFNQFPTQLQHPVSEYFQRNIHITTAGVFTLPPLLCSLMVVGAPRILFSVDYPYSTTTDATAFLRAAEISAPDKELIAHGNAERLFGI